MDEKKFQTSSESEHLRAMLHEDTEATAELDELLQVVSRLKQWEAPRVDGKATMNLLEMLEQEMPTPIEQSPARRWSEWWPLLLMRSQFRVVRREIWAASALIMLLGTLVTLTTFNVASPDGATPIAILAPLVAAFGVALLYDSDVEQMLELEDSTPASVRLLLLARLTLVFGFDLLLALLGSIVLAATHANVSLWPLVMSWLAPMTFLSGLAFTLSIFTGDAVAGSLVGLMVWGTHVLMRTAAQSGWLPYLLSLPGLSALETRPLLLVLAPLLVVLALWWVGHNERRIGDLN